MFTGFCFYFHQKKINIHIYGYSALNGASRYMHFGCDATFICLNMLRLINIHCMGSIVDILVTSESSVVRVFAHGAKGRRIDPP